MANVKHICAKCGRERAAVVELYSKHEQGYGEVYRTTGVYICVQTTSCKVYRKKARRGAVARETEASTSL